MAKGAAGSGMGAGGMAMPAWLHRLAAHRGLAVPIAFVTLLVVILVPLPPWLMDVLISLNVSLAVIILLTTIYMTKPLDFSVFPSLLLATTLFRLVLNVASTRLILNLNADTPEGAMHVAGHVIAAFGSFVAGQSVVVGVIIFMILVIVQFVVISKGATRISEVAARFTLDAMPGKQMAIDSDLNAGLINEGQARARREEISREADFYGAMDGASKFVRGDAIAGIIITFVNIAGGFVIGMIEHNWGVGETLKVFTTLTIGDGLASQIPSFVISIAAALTVTRSGSKEQLGDEMTGQIFSQPLGLGITAGFLCFLAMTPLPTIPLLFTGGMLGLSAWRMTRSRKVKKMQQTQEEDEKAKAPPEPPAPEKLLKLDTLEIEVGYGLVALVDPHQGGDLLDRISALRREMAAEIGFILPPVRIRDNMQLPGNEYRIKLRGAEIASWQVQARKLLAMDSGLVSGRIEGERTVEPAFGLEAFWIDPAQKARAEAMNYTVVDPSSVVATHLTEMVRRHADELLTREEVFNLVDQLKEKAPKLVEEAVPNVVKLGDLQRVLQNLLRERVSIRDLETILETLCEWMPRTKDMDVLTEYVRNALRRSISHQHAAVDDGGVRKIMCVTLDPALEDQINGYVDRSGGTTIFRMPSHIASEIAGRIARALEKVVAAGRPPVVLASPPVRAIVRQIIETKAPSAVVLGYNEIVPEVEVETCALVSAESRTPAGAAR